MQVEKTKAGREQHLAAPPDNPQKSSSSARLRLEILIVMLVGAYIVSLLVGGALSAALGGAIRDSSGHRKTCTVRPGGSEDIDDAPAIREAFEHCGHNGNVVFLNTTYYVNTVMNTSGLRNCQVDIYGTLLWGTDIDYWLNNSLPVGYQNQSTAWIIGGDQVTVDGHGYGTLNGNGDVWYTFASGISNYPRRPHAMTVANTTDSTFQGLRFIRSQMWSLSIIWTQRTEFNSIYVNNTSSQGEATENTDGADTIYSSFISFKDWIVDNGDDAISPKANSTDITINDCTFYSGSGIAIGSIGQYKGVFETIERVYVNNIKFISTLHAVYFKTWTGEQAGYPPNGGGGGLGFASDLHFKNIHAETLRGPAYAISQCTTFGSAVGNCSSSQFQLSDISFTSTTGTLTTDVVASFQCSAEKPCENISILDEQLTVSSNGSLAESYLCYEVENPIGWECTGEACVGGSASGNC